MGGNVSVLLETNAPVPSIVITTQHEVRARPDPDSDGSSATSALQLPSLPPKRDVVERCPKIRVMAADKAQEILGVGGSASVAWEAKRTPPPPPLSAEESPVLLVKDCADPAAFTTSRTYIPVMNAIVAYVEGHGKGNAAAADKRRDSSGRVMCPIGLDFDPTLCLGNRLTRAEARAACAEYCKLFLTHLIAALENVGNASQEDAPSTRTSTSSYSMGRASAVATNAVVPHRFFLLYIDARSGQLDDATGEWLASSLIMSAVRRTRPYTLVSTRTNTACGSRSGGGNDNGSGDRFISYFSPDVKADMTWASLQHILLTHNKMSLPGVKTVLEALLAEDAAHEVLLQQRGVDAKAQKAAEVMKAVTQNRLFPRQGSKLLPQLYLVDVRHNLYDDAEVEVLEKMALTSDGNKAESAVAQACSSLKHPLKSPVSQAERSDCKITLDHMSLADEPSLGPLPDDHNGTDARGGLEGAAPVQAKPRTASHPLMTYTGVPSVPPEREKPGSWLRSPRAPPDSIKEARLAEVDTAEAAIDKVPDGLIMGRSTRRLSSISPRSETRATGLVAISPTSATQQRTALLQSPRSLNARKHAPPLSRVDAVELERAYKVLRSQRPDSARKASAAATPSSPTSARQRMSSPLLQLQSSLTRAGRVPELYREEDELDDAEMEVHSLAPHLRRYPHPRSQCGSRSGRAESGAWLDEAYTQSHRDGTSPVRSTGSRRRCYDIPSLAPPEPFFATSAARIPPAMREADLRKVHETLVQVASPQASPELACWRRKTIYDDVQPRVYSRSHLSHERWARAGCESVSATEARARERIREYAEKRDMARLRTGHGYSASARQHQARHLSSSLQMERGVVSGRTSPCSKPASPSPAPQQPAAAVGAVEKATPPTTPTDPNVASARAQTSSVHGRLHGGVAAAPGSANDSPTLQCQRPPTTVSMGNTAKRRLPATGPPRITPRGNLTSQLRRITSQRQRRFAKVEENEDAYYARSRQPRRKFRMPHVTATMRAPWAQPLEMAAVLQEQKRCASIGYPRSSAPGAPMMATTSPLRRGDTAPQREWDSPARATSSDGSLVPMTEHTQGSGHPSAAWTPEYNENGIELVHMKLRTRVRAVF